jgi:hypothetical protein
MPDQGVHHRIYEGTYETEKSHYASIESCTNPVSWQPGGAGPAGCGALGCDGERRAHIVCPGAAAPYSTALSAAADLCTALSTAADLCTTPSTAGARAASAITGVAIADT